LTKLGVIVSGMPASGKTMLAKVLSQKFGFRYYCGGDALKELAVEKGYLKGGQDWWDTKEGMHFLSERSKNPDFDKEVDKMLLRTLEQGNVVMTSYSLPWLADKGLKIWIKASQESRAKRMVFRDKITYEQALEIVRRRDSENQDLYARIYGIRFGEDLSVFDFVIGSDNLQSIGVIKIVSSIIRQFL
jgi:cytidylate kinase